MPEGQETPQQEPQEDSSPDKEIGRTLAERHPDWPHVKVKFYFSAHNTAQDIEGMKKHVKDSDIYLYEHGAGDLHTEPLQTLANMDPATMHPDYIDDVIKYSTIGGQSFQDTVNESIYRSIYGSKKIVGHIDLRHDDAALSKELSASYREPYIALSFDETLTNLKKNWEKIVDLQEQREEIMTTRFEEELEKIIQEHPELKDKHDIKVLATMGSYHTPLLHKFRDKGIDAERDLPHTPYTYDFGVQVQREIAFGKEPSRDILAKAFLGDIIRSVMSENIQNSDDKALYLRHTAEQFTTEEIETFHGFITTAPITPEIIDNILRVKGINPIPKTNEELKTFVEKQKTELSRLREQKASSQQRRQLGK